MYCRILLSVYFGEIVAHFKHGNTPSVEALTLEFSIIGAHLCTHVEHRLL